MLIRSLTLGPYQTNCYIAAAGRSGKAILIDPGDEPERILAVLRHLSLEVACIVNTHAHVDHMGADSAIQQATGAPILIHSADAPLLSSPSSNLSSLLGQPLQVPEPLSAVSPPRLLEEGEKVEAGGLVLTVLHTPGHTPGSICLLGQGLLFSGDLLFAGGVGRTDFPGGSQEQLAASLRRVLKLGDQVVVYPGHGPKTTIGAERQVNPWLTQLL